jgi:ubiquinone/menaquinone biosynthesis C-methylase UbiE
MFRGYSRLSWPRCERAPFTSLQLLEKIAMSELRSDTHVRYSARQYDDYTSRFVKPYDELMAARIVEESSRRPGSERLLDVGTGTAQFLIYLAQFEPLAGLSLVGSDLFSDMIERGRASVAEAKLDARIELVQADAHEMPFPDQFADIIISRSTLHHWRSPALALQEIYRILKPGGVAIIMDVRRDADAEAVAEFNRLRALSGLGPSQLDEKFTADEVRAFAADAGLAHCSRVYAPKRGMGALGLSLEIEKSAPSS